MIAISSIKEKWNCFFHDSGETQICDIFRIIFSGLLLINLLVLAPDLLLWFGESGLMPYDVSRKIIDQDTFTLFSLLPESDIVIYIAYSLLLLHVIALGLGIYSQLNAVFAFIWLSSFYHRHIILFDGEDTVFRLFLFFMIFMPLGKYFSVSSWLRSKKPKPELLKPKKESLWALRMIQIQMTLIYVSTIWEKLDGSDWLDGYALYYVSQLDDLYGKFPVPELLTNPDLLGQWMTWSVLLVEFLLPICLWIKSSRRYAIIIGICFHLSIEYSMNLFLFQWVMILGLISFVKKEDLIWLGLIIKQLKVRVARTEKVTSKTAN